MKKITAFLLVVAMCLGFVVCAHADSVTLNVVTSYGGDDGNRKNFEDAVAAYEASTGNKVNDGSATSNEQWKAKVLTDFETGSEPDVLFFFTNADHRRDPLRLPRLRRQHEGFHDGCRR